MRNEDEIETSGREFGVLSEEDYMAVQEEYRIKQLKESLMGWTCSTTMHAALLLFLAVYCIGSVPPKPAEITMIPQKVEEIAKDPPPPPPPQQKPIVEPDPTVTEDASPAANVPTIEPEVPSSLDQVDDNPPSTNDEAVTEQVSLLKPSESSFLSASNFCGIRSNGRRTEILKGICGPGDNGPGVDGHSPVVPVDTSLAWLAKVQNPDGSWGTGGETNGLTGLALLSFLANGETPISKNYGRTVASAITFLSAGGKTDSHDYGHAIKTYALCEAYAMTQHYDLKDVCMVHVEKIVKAQQAGGCFDYNYSADQKRQDLSYAGWNFQALKAAKVAGIEVPNLDAAISKAVTWLKTYAAANKFCYSSQDNSTAQTRNLSRQSLYDSIGTLCLQLYGEGDIPELKEEIRGIGDKEIRLLDWKKAPAEALYGWYYSTQVLFQAGDKEFKRWFRECMAMMKDNQNPAGYWEHPGTFHGKEQMEQLEGRIYATTFCALILSTPYRYTVVNRDAKGHKKEKASEKAPKAVPTFDILN